MSRIAASRAAHSKLELRAGELGRLGGGLFQVGLRSEVGQGGKITGIGELIESSPVIFAGPGMRSVGLAADQIRAHPRAIQREDCNSGDGPR